MNDPAKIVTERPDGCGITLYKDRPNQVDMERWEVRELAAILNALITKWGPPGSPELPNVDVLYFGCYHGTGHYLRRKSGVQVNYRDQPWTDLDQGILDRAGVHGAGVCVTERKDGWTAVSFEDNSVDSRPGSNSAFLCAARVSTHILVTLARQQWPEIFARPRFPTLRSNNVEDAI